jgi:predicted DNA-binding protein with PD1-like motif
MMIVANLERGSDLLESLEKLAAQNGIQAGVFTAIGAVKRAAFTYYDQSKRGYVDLAKDEGLEVVSCSGNLGILEGKPKIHCHIVFSDRDGRTFGGHLLRGTEVFVVEVHVVEMKGAKLNRRVDSATGIPVLSF